MKTFYFLKHFQKRLFLTVLFFSFVSNSTLFAATAKHIAVPAEEISQQKLPDAKSTGVFSHSTMLALSLTPQTSSYLTSRQEPEIFQQSIYFDGEKNTPLILISPFAENWSMMISDPNGQTVLDEGSSQSKQLTVKQIKIGQESYRGKQFVIQQPTVGEWKVTFTEKENLQNSSRTAIKTQKDQPHAYLMFKGDPNYQMYAYLDDQVALQHKSIKLITYAVDATQSKHERNNLLSQQALVETIQSAIATITTPSKKRIQLKMYDDGTHGDEIAGDGRFTQNTPTDEVGVYTSHILIQGIRPDGARFSRSASDLYSIEAESWQFSGADAQLSALDKNRVKVSIPFQQAGAAPAVFLSAELWGTNARGQQQAAAWIGGIADATSNQSEHWLSLAVDARWLKREKLVAPFSLKSVRLQTANNNVPIAKFDRLNIQFPNSLFTQLTQPTDEDKKLFASNRQSTDFNREMLMGQAPINQQIKNATATSKLLLVHGYCSGKVWSTSNFSNSAEFQDYSKNRSHDEFAQQIINFGSDYSSYGIVAHSQGGAAALHLYSRYWSGLDYATGGRLIQSVGTPYQGTALAGNAALLGQLFGIGCGTNTDLTYSGAANWLATIPSWARAEVDFYTTSFKTRWWAYDYCHLATDLFLNDPEDGTTEKWSGQLSGAANKGHKTGWCHTTGMRDTAQYKDSSRNSSMNSRAAR